tara:strand:+ start:944 stop:1636 length:693 start_codon:yes stop_codon:yes gene_type:complete
MKLLLENWREYLNEEEEALLLVEEIWSGLYVNELVLLEHQQELLEEGIGALFSGTFSAVKGKIDAFNSWKENQLMTFIESAITRIQQFFQAMRNVARQTANQTLMKLFPKYGTRHIQGTLAVFKKPQYLKAGAAILSMVLQKFAELGVAAILNTLSGGGATAAKAATFIQQNMEKIKLFIESIKAALDPNGIITFLEKVPAFVEAAQLLAQLKSDLQNPFRDLTSALPTG